MNLHEKNDDEFIVCPNCGVRNFVDDITCGICFKILPESSKRKDPAENVSQQQQPTIDLSVKTTNISKTNNTRPIKLVLLAFVTLSIIFIVNKKGNKVAVPSYLNTSGVKYQIVEKEIGNPTRAVIHVRINDMVEHDELSKLAYLVKSEVHPTQERVFIFFLLPEMTSTDGAWARADFDPNLNIVYIGNSLKTQQEIIKNLQKINDFIGIWIDRSMPEDILIRIRKDRRLGLVFEYISSKDPKPSSMPSVLITTKIDGQTIYRDPESNVGEYFIIQPNGDLSAFDKDGFIASFKRVK